MSDVKTLLLLAAFVTGGAACRSDPGPLCTAGPDGTSMDAEACECLPTSCLAESPPIDVESCQNSVEDPLCGCEWDDGCAFCVCATPAPSA